MNSKIKEAEMDIKEVTKKIASDTVFSVKGSNDACLETLEMNDVNCVKNNYTDFRNISKNCGGKVQSWYIVKEAWLREELRGKSKLE